MTRTQVWLIVGTIVVGVVLLRFGYVYGADANYVPSRLPFPGLHYTVNDEFTILTGGRFALQVILPWSYSERAHVKHEQPDIVCDLNLVIAGPHGFVIRRPINRLHNCAWTRDTTIYCPDSLLVLPKGGLYTISLTTRSRLIELEDRGALLQLTRFEAVGPELSYPIARWLAYGCFICAIIITLCSGKEFGARGDTPGTPP
jgi:hypothetical protein